MDVVMVVMMVIMIVAMAGHGAAMRGADAPPAQTEAATPREALERSAR